MMTQTEGIAVEELFYDYYFDLQNTPYPDLFTGCKYVWDPLSKIESYLKSKQLGIIDTFIPENAILVNEELISIGKGTVVEPGAYIKGPCIIGENCQIRQGAYIRGNFICGNDCVIGHATEVKNSIFFNHAQAAHFAYVGDSILGYKTNLGAGTICANLRFDKKPIRFFINGKNVDTHLKKFGAVFGDFSQSGCNSVMNPGTLLGKRALISPCSNAKGVIREGRVFFADGSIETFVYH